jgi:hypothetical protein
MIVPRRSVAAAALLLGLLAPLVAGDDRLCDDRLVAGCGAVRGKGPDCVRLCAAPLATQNADCHDVSNPQGHAQAFCTAGINPLYKQTITVYHVNPAVYGDEPVDMNTADAHGDMYFSFKTAYLPVQCQGLDADSGMAGFTCGNAETTDPNLVITKLSLEVDGRYGQYQMCNVCVNGKDPLGSMGRRRALRGGSRGNHSARTCSMTGGDGVVGSNVPEYICDCHSRGGGGACDDTQVGREDIGQMFGGRRRGGGSYNYTRPGYNYTRPGYNYTRPGRRRRGGGYPGGGGYNWTQPGGRRRRGGGYPGRGNYSRPEQRISTRNWDTGLARKLGGYWYSTRKAGMCTTSSDWCNWRVAKTVKRVSKDCADNSIYTYVEAKDTRGCFRKCATPNNGAVRNMSDVCWVTCFFETVLGANSTHGTVNETTDGLSLAQLDEAWDRVFASDNAAIGGCPSLEAPAPTPPTFPASPSCTSCSTLQELSACTSDVNRACCKHGGCESGEPSMCNAECESVLLPMARTCTGFLQANYGLLPISAALQRSVTTCKTQNPKAVGPLPLPQPQPQPQPQPEPQPQPLPLPEPLPVPEPVPEPTMPVDFCASNPCQHNANCASAAGTYACRCSAGFSGTNCDTTIEPCLSRPCLNGGACSDSAPGSFVCACSAGYTGPTCQIVSASPPPPTLPPPGLEPPKACPAGSVYQARQIDMVSTCCPVPGGTCPPLTCDLECKDSALAFYRDCNDAISALPLNIQQQLNSFRSLCGAH